MKNVRGNIKRCHTKKITREMNKIACKMRIFLRRNVFSVKHEYRDFRCFCYNIFFNEKYNIEVWSM